MFDCTEPKQGATYWCPRRDPRTSNGHSLNEIRQKFTTSRIGLNDAPSRPIYLLMISHNRPITRATTAIDLPMGRRQEGGDRSHVVEPINACITITLQPVVKSGSMNIQMRQRLFDREIRSLNQLYDLVLR